MSPSRSSSNTRKNSRIVKSSNLAPSSFKHCISFKTKLGPYASPKLMKISVTTSIFKCPFIFSSHALKIYLAKSTSAIRPKLFAPAFWCFLIHLSVSALIKILGKEIPLAYPGISSSRSLIADSIEPGIVGLNRLDFDCIFSEYS